MSGFNTVISEWNKATEKVSLGILFWNALTFQRDSLKLMSWSSVQQQTPSPDYSATTPFSFSWDEGVQHFPEKTFFKLLWVWWKSRGIPNHTKWRQYIKAATIWRMSLILLLTSLVCYGYYWQNLVQMKNLWQIWLCDYK